MKNEGSNKLYHLKELLKFLNTNFLQIFPYLTLLFRYLVLTDMYTHRHCIYSITLYLKRKVKYGNIVKG